MANKYKNLVYFNEPELASAFIDGTVIENVDQEIRGVGIRGACQLPGAKANISGGLITEAVFIDPYPHKHLSDEYLAFLGPPTDRFDFDAHIEFTMGLGDEAEHFDIDEPTIVRIPAGTWHCPLNFVRIGRPVFFQVALMQGAFGGTYLLPDGEKELWYNGQIKCILDSGKKCNVCQKCLQINWDNYPGRK